MSGWIKLHRKTLDNPVVCKDSDHLAVWSYILLNATHKEYPSMFLGKKISLQPGQLITGRKVIAEKFNISESKVQRILKSFENEQQIEQQNGNKNRLITVLTWSEYQDGEQQIEQQVNNNRTTDEQQVNTYKNVKNLKNEKNLKEPTTPTVNPFRLFESEGFGTISSTIAEKLGDMIDFYSERWVIEAMKRAVVAGKRNLTYVEGVLKGYKSEGVEEPWTVERNVGQQRQGNQSSFQRPRKTFIPIVADKPATSVSAEELEELRKLAKKLDGTG